jgi:hypothetical protein
MSSVIILQINLDRILAIPAECDPPVAGRVHGVTAFALALEGVKSEDPADSWRPELSPHFAEGSYPSKKTNVEEPQIAGNI